MINKSAFSSIHMLTMWHCPHSRAAAAAINQYLLSTGPIADGWDSQCQTDARQLERPCSPHYVGSANNYQRQTILKVLSLLILGRWEWEQTWQKFIPQRQDNNGGQLLRRCMLPFLPPSFLLSTLIGPVSVRPLGLTTIWFNSRRPGVSRRPLGMESYTCRPIS